MGFYIMLYTADTTHGDRDRGRESLFSTCAHPIPIPIPCSVYEPLKSPYAFYTGVKFFSVYDNDILSKFDFRLASLSLTTAIPQWLIQEPHTDVFSVASPQCFQLKIA